MKPMLNVSESVPCIARWNSRFSVEMLPVWWMMEAEKSIEGGIGRFGP